MRNAHFFFFLFNHRNRFRFYCCEVFLSRFQVARFQHRYILCTIHPGVLLSFTLLTTRDFHSLFSYRCNIPSRPCKNTCNMYNKRSNKNSLVYPVCISYIFNLALIYYPFEAVPFPLYLRS